MLGGNPGTPQNPGSPATNLLYAGEQFDTNLQMYYNRARYYDQNTGRFNRIDPFSGNLQDPQSLHKYLYGHCNPVNAIDPTGEMTLTELLVAITVIGFLLGLILGPGRQASIRRAEARTRATEEAEAVTFLMPGHLKQINRDMLVSDNPEVRNMNLAFWHQLANGNKAVTYQSCLAEERFLKSIKIACNALEVTGTALAVAAPIVTFTSKVPAKIIWSRPHPPDNPAHWDTITDNVLRRGSTGELRKIYTHSSLGTITDKAVNSQLKPDWAEVLWNGRIRIYEVRSPKQRHVQLLEKGWTYKQLLRDKLEFYDVLEIGDVVP